MRLFNTEGPAVAAKPYCIPPLARVNRAEALGLIEAEHYFVLHAPWQTGKTSALHASVPDYDHSLPLHLPRQRIAPQ